MYQTVTACQGRCGLRALAAELQEVADSSGFLAPGGSGSATWRIAPRAHRLLWFLNCREVSELTECLKVLEAKTLPRLGAP
ncbi:unnamed protein product [Rangifer tarandus platyrhynchus]|uniref:Uncharacterized protein n=2 Tax=Rangifer tarandus platyrhynchus TaxID=3082113 RepID=A0ACB0EV58_RANTA|nr:unnamed protein product [Rangifer tarandus platyrhynchus]CAI9703861.1 unnamed protein product [Rangifer tarandus platyrhynchus]